MTISYFFRLSKPLVLVLVLLFIGSITVLAQNPSYVITSEVGTYTPVANPTALLLRSGATSTDDEYYRTIDLNALSFNFVYNTRRVTSLIPTTNGTIGIGAIPYQPVNNLVAYNNLMSGVRSGVEFLAPFGIDLNSSLADVSYSVTGPSGSKILTIQFRNFRFNASTQRAIDFQVRLYEEGNVIEYQYANAADQTTLGVCVGMRGPLPSLSGSINLTNPSFNWSEPVRALDMNSTMSYRSGQLPANGLIYRFVPDANLNTPDLNISGNLTSNSTCAVITTGRYIITNTGIVPARNVQVIISSNQEFLSPITQIKGRGRLLASGVLAYDEIAASDSIILSVTGSNFNATAGTNRQLRVRALLLSRRDQDTTDNTITRNLTSLGGGTTGTYTPTIALEIRNADGSLGSFCDANSFRVLTVTNPRPNTSYIWSDGNTGDSIALPANTQGNYNVVAYDNTTCQRGASTPLSVTGTSLLPIYNPSTYPIFCLGQEVSISINQEPNERLQLFEAGGNLTTLSSSSPSAVLQTFTFSPPAGFSGKIYLRKLRNGCTTEQALSSRGIAFVSPTPPRPSIAGGSVRVYCAGAGNVLSVANPSNQFRYRWSNGVEGTSITVNVPGSYTVQAFDTAAPRNSCPSAPSTAVNVQDFGFPDNVTITPTSRLLLAPSRFVDLQATSENGWAIRWELNGDTIIGFGNQLRATRPGIYRAYAVNPQGCIQAFNTVTVEEDFVLFDMTYDFTTRSQTYTSLPPVNALTPLTPSSGGVPIARIQIGFPFQLANRRVDSLIISPNGQFYANQLGELIPDQMLQRDTLVSYLLPLGVDMLFDASSSIRTALTGTAPNRVRTIELLNLRTGFAVNGRYTYQVRLFEQTNLIEYHYGPSTPSTATSFFGCQVGLHASRNGISRRLGIDGSWSAPTKVVNYDAGQSNIGLSPTNSPAPNRVFAFTPVDLRPIVIDQIDRVAGRNGNPDTLLMSGFGLNQITQVVVRDAVSFSPAQPNGSRQEFGADFLRVLNGTTIKVVFANRSFVRGLAIYTTTRLIPIDIPVCNLNYRPTLSNPTNGATRCGSPLGQVISLNDTLTTGDAIYQWYRNGTLIATGGSAHITLPGLYTLKYGLSETGCMVDLPNATFRFDTTKTTRISRTICANASTTVGNQTFTQSGNYRVTLNSNSGCDSVILLTLTTRPVVETTIRQSICQGNTYLFGSQLLTTPGTYTQIVPNAHGCDSSITLLLTVNPTQTTTLNARICRNQAYTFGNQNLTTSGLYSLALTNRLGCDSIVRLNLEVVERLTSRIERRLCEGDSTLFFGQWLKQSGSYNQNLTTASGCDSTVTLALVVLGRSQSQISALICEGQNYSFGNQILNQAGIYTRTLPNALGCDSTITLNLSVSQPNFTLINTQICEGQVFRFADLNINAPGTYAQTLTNRLGCDSTITLQLSIRPLARTQLQATICQGEAYRFGNRFLSIPGTYNQTLRAANGCDSLVTLVLQVRPLSSTTLNQAICEGQGFVFAGNVRTEAGIYTDTLTNSLGCDSVVILHLRVNQPTVTRLQATICQGQSYSFGTALLNQSGTYARTLTSQTGCDSTISVQLTVNPIDSLPIRATICANESYRFGNSNLNLTGNYLQTLVNRLGCDSIVSLSLTVRPVSQSSLTARICQGNTYQFGNQNLTTSGTYSLVLANQFGCDSVVQLTLTVAPIAQANLNVTICQGQTYLFGNQILSTSGVYTQTLTQSNGCDSLVTLQLRVNPISTTRITQLICQGQPYQFGNQIITTSGTYTRNLTSQAGCDSSIILTLIVNPTRTSNLNIALCEGRSYPFGNQNLTSEGTYTRTISSSSGCDSTITLNLTLLPVPNRRLSVRICEGQSINFGSQILTNPGAYTRTVPNPAGCDSIIQLDLTVSPQRQTALQQSICEGSSISFGNQILTRTGLYTRSMVASTGCDSLIRLNLTVVQTPPIPTVFVDNGSLQVSDDLAGDRYVWLNGLTNSPITGLTGALINSFDSTGITCLRVLRIRNSCPSDTSELICRTSSQTRLAKSLRLYPNPTQGPFYIEGIGIQHITLLNTLGQAALSQTVNPIEKTTLIPCGNLPSGMYLIQIQTTYGVITDRILIKK